MIISASYKTDIPTFYGEWFLRRLAAGYCKMVNPYNRAVYEVSLRDRDVAAFVFWTKNVHPFLGALTEVKARGFPFVVQFTINGYPRALETSVVDAARSVASAWRLREAFGPRVLIWRYDTVVMSSLTPPEFHVENFRRLAAELEGATDEVVISFAHLYRKTKRNMDEAAAKARFIWRDPSSQEKRNLVGLLLKEARARRMALSVCSQPEFLVEGAEDARCVDAARLTQIAGTSIAAKLRGNRKECGCYESRDIGEYDTCPHGCVYCYAVQDRPRALQRFRRHNPKSEFLFEPETPPKKGGEGRNLSLFVDDD